MPSWLLVALQFALIGALIVTTRPLGSLASNVAAAVLLLIGGATGVAALAVNRPGNFNIRPELKSGAQLVTRGIYRQLRHPMYLAVLLVMAAGIAADPRAWRWLLWIALLAVLLAKLAREERNLRTAFPDYAAYAARTRRLIPGVF
ncbi:MAG: methyltransferase family protein [Gemmatimonadota bacterium]